MNTEPTGAPPATPVPTGPAGARSVLVVDDDDAVRSVLCELLEETGFDVVGQGADGVEAVSLAAGLDPDVVLLDVRMPRLDGLGAARQIRSQNPEVLLVMLTAYDDSSLQREARDAGARAFLVKGCSLAELIDALGA